MKNAPSFVHSFPIEMSKERPLQGGRQKAVHWHKEEENVWTGATEQEE